MTATALPSQSRSSSASSRNDLFSASWAPEVPPPKPLREIAPRDDAPRRRASLRREEESYISRDHSQPPPVPAIGHSPRTSSFFDGPAFGEIAFNSLPPTGLIAPTKLSTLPGNLSRSSSLRSRLLPPVPLHLPHQPQWSDIHDEDPFSPLHQSPSLPSIPGDLPSWQPPLPPSSEDVNLRFEPSSTYLLGEGRYAKVYLASYKRDSKAFDRNRPVRGPATHTEIGNHDINLFGDTWRLCAAKRMTPDRESQIMGLREAFFLDRLSGSSSGTKNSLRDSTESGRRRGGSVYVVKLIAVKEEREQPRRGWAHGRSASDIIATDVTSPRPRSFTLALPQGSDSLSTLSSSPSLPALAHAAKLTHSAPSLSRWVLLLEHAPLGTLDRLLRTSPALVGRRLWERWAREGAEALEWVHSRGVVHADIKPGNLLLTTDLHIRLSDFGSSLLIHPSHPPMDGLGLGTLPFSPPELVDANQTFSFPVDIFALGATLYQCITGREPYRGIRTVEMMHHVRNGGLWVWEERERMTRVGDDSDRSVAGSPYPSAWRGVEINGVKRAGSLRVPPNGPQQRLPRMSSAESMRASDDAVDGSNSEDSPAGVKLWAAWVTTQRTTPGRNAISLLLGEGEDDGQASATASPSSSSMITPTPSRPTAVFSPTSPVQEVERKRLSANAPAYADGSPPMMFLDGRERVCEQVREVIRAMVDPVAEERPFADELRRIWEELNIGDDDREVP